MQLHVLPPVTDADSWSRQELSSPRQTHGWWVRIPPEARISPFILFVLFYLGRADVIL
jgi:hypothetical protein